MPYDWGPHEKTCYRLYVDEKKSLEDVMEYMKVHHRFTPCKRSYLTQFRRWDFPSRHQAAHKNEPLVARIKELWERNTPQNEMLRILTEEDGFDIGRRGLKRLRMQNKWLLRSPNGLMSEPASPGQLDHGLSSGQSSSQDTPLPMNAKDAVSTEDEALQKLAAAPEVVWGSNSSVVRKRRRPRPRDDAAPADQPQPRFPCETTLDKARTILSLDNDAYRDIRAAFARICDEEDIVKKTIAGPDKWEAAKERLVTDTPQLHAVMSAEDEIEPKKLAVDVICTDVTKRRRMESRMTLGEAKETLGINPEESREIRLAFHRLLQEDRIVSKSETSDEKWDDLKGRWVAGSPLLRRILARGDADPARQPKAKAVDCIALDVLKRMREDQTRRDRTKKRPATPRATPSPKRPQKSSPAEAARHALPAPPSPMEVENPVDDGGYGHDTAVSQLSHMELVPRGTNRSVPIPLGLQTPTPSLQDAAEALTHSQSRLLSTSVLNAQTPLPLESQLGSALLLGEGPSPFVDDQYVQQFAAAHQAAAQVFQAVAAPPPPPQPEPSSVAVYLRLHPSSTFVTATTLWIATLSSPSLQELRHIATEKWPGAICLRVEGLLKDGKGAEVPLGIDQDQELEAYLAHVQGWTPTFKVQLVPAWKP